MKDEKAMIKAMIDEITPRPGDLIAEINAMFEESQLRLDELLIMLQQAERRSLIADDEMMTVPEAIDALKEALLRECIAQTKERKERARKPRNRKLPKTDALRTEVQQFRNNATHAEAITLVAVKFGVTEDAVT